MNRKAVKGSTKAGANPRERKLADRPQFERKNERKSPDHFDLKGGGASNHNKHLWTDPGHENEARQQVRGAAVAVGRAAGVRHGERTHGPAVEMQHFGHSAGEIGEHQAAIIDKHAQDAHIFKNKSGHKAAEQLAPESRSRRAVKN